MNIDDVDGGVKRRIEEKEEGEKAAAAAAAVKDFPGGVGGSGGGNGGRSGDSGSQGGPGRWWRRLLVAVPNGAVAVVDLVKMVQIHPVEAV